MIQLICYHYLILCESVPGNSGLKHFDWPKIYIEMQSIQFIAQNKLKK